MMNVSLRILGMIYFFSILQYTYSQPVRASMPTLISAIYSNKVDEVASLLAAGAEVDLKYHCSTPLLCAIMKQSPEIVALLLSFGATVNSHGKFCVPPLCLASSLGNKDIVELLLKAKADVTEKDRWGGSAMHYAQTKNYSEIIELLKAYGAQEEIIITFD